MKSKYTSPAAGWVLAVLLVCAPSAWSQNYEVIFNFGNHGGALDLGANPAAGLTLDSHGNLYGTALFGGYYGSACFGGCGTVFELSPNGRGGWNGKPLHYFTGTYGSEGGGIPNAPVVFDRQGNLYGVDNCTSDCGGFAGGTVFKLSPVPNGFWRESILHVFGASGCQPVPTPQLCSAGLDQHGHLYGTTPLGGSQGFGSGNVFSLTQVSITNWYYAVIFAFSGGDDGSTPNGQIIFDAQGNIYGTAFQGGSAGLGVVYKVVPNGGAETVLYSFSGGPADGANPIAGVVFDAAGNIYGTTSAGGSAGLGTVFMLTPQANGTWTETILYSFQGGADAATPSSSLTFDAAGDLYGTAGGGSPGQGTLFKLSPSGGGHWAESIVHTFTGGMDGGNPYGGVIFDTHGNVYGTASTGGNFTGGVAYEITP